MGVGKSLISSWCISSLVRKLSLCKPSRGEKIPNFRWVYELCHGKKVRQFHETTLLDQLSGVSATQIETEHILGVYKPEDHESYPAEEEWKHVVNATVYRNGIGDAGSKKHRRRTPTALGGNGAYYYQEYTSGDVCEHPDVTEAAIKAGEVGKGVIQRSSTVRYSCGSKLRLEELRDHPRTPPIHQSIQSTALPAR